MAMGVVAVLGGSGAVLIGGREGTATASQAQVGLRWSRGCRVVEEGRLVVVLVVVSVVVKADGFIEVRLSRVAVVDHD